MSLKVVKQLKDLFTVFFSLVFLIILGTIAARAGDSSIKKAVIRLSFWGTIAIGITAFIGYLFNVGVV